MGQLVLFTIGDGSFEQGFPVSLEITEEGKRHPEKISGRLPPAPEIPQLYARWQATYRSLGVIQRIDIPPNVISNVSTREECVAVANALSDGLNNWLNHRSMHKLTGQLLQNVNSGKQVRRFILQIQNPVLRRLPWHLWDLFADFYPQAEITLSAEYQPFFKKLKSPVRILAIQGSSTGGINPQADLAALKQHLQPKGAIVQLLLEPSWAELQHKLWHESWDMLFFAGHSYSFDDDSCGEILLRDHESVSLAELRNALSHAVQNGLKLAIFNSCDGLGLAQYLAQLRIPYIIVMREVVPDEVAREFLRDFLTTFARGKSFYSSVQQARRKLEDMHRQYPCASWLPVICQNPAAAELKYPQAVNWKKIALLAAGVTAIAICGWLVGDEINFRNRFSFGEKLLMSSVTSTDKEAGVKAYRRQDFATAERLFTRSLSQEPNDPESRIYLNNSKIGNQQALYIAVAVPIGKNPDVAQEILRGVAQAQQEVNQGDGIDGKQLKVQIANDDNQPEIAIRVAKRLVVQRQILAVVGHNSSDASVAASNIYQQQQLVMVSPTSSSNQLTERTDRINGNYIFRTVLSAERLAQSLANFAKATGKTKIAICTDSQARDQSFGQSFLQAVSDNNGEIINISCNLAKPNFQPAAAIEQAKKAKADSLLLDPHVDRINQALAVARVNQGMLPLLGNPSFQTAKTLQQGKADVNGMVIVVPWNAKASANKAFPEKARSLWGNKVHLTWRTATAYDATMAIVKALREMDNTREGLQNALSHNFSMQGVTGTVKFSLSGDRYDNPVLLQVQPNPQVPPGKSKIEPSSKSSSGFDFFPLK